MGRTHFSGPVAVKDEHGKWVDLTANPKQPDIPDITTDMSEDPYAEELKQKINEILAVLRAANIIG